MAQKLGNGGHGPEEFNPANGQYVADGAANSSYDNPNENHNFRKQLENPVIYDPYDTGNYGTEEALERYNEAALEMIMEETGMGYADALYFQDCLHKYLGENYEDFTSGYEKERTRAIDEGLARMAKFDGDMARGMSFKLIGGSSPEEDTQNRQRLQRVLELMKPGAIYQPNVLQSWTDVSDIAKTYADTDRPEYASILLYVRKGKNKSAVGVKHISKFGDLESEVLAPSNVKYRVSSVFSMPKMVNPKYARKYAGIPNRVYQIILEEI